MGIVRRAAFFLLALPLVVRASARCAWWERRLPLDALVDRLRAVPPLDWAPLANPPWLLATLDRLSGLLPPWRYGRCLKRSLLLLDLWSRCGLCPRLHLGVRREDETRYQGHAWVTVDPSPGADTVSTLGTATLGYQEAFVF
jgi:transglutaminase superfamily protein